MKISEGQDLDLNPLRLVLQASEFPINYNFKDARNVFSYFIGTIFNKSIKRIS